MLPRRELMKMKPVVQYGVRMFQLGDNDLVETPMRIKMQIGVAMVQVHRVQQSHQAQVMVAVKVTNEDIANAMKADVGLLQLKLRALATVDHEVAVLNVYIL